MSPAQRQTDGPVVDSNLDFVGNLIGRTLDHLRWVSLMALVLAVLSQSVREQYGLELLIGMVVIAALAAFVELGR